MKLSRAEIVDSFEGNSPFTLYILGEYPSKKDVQLDVYKTLEELRKRASMDVLLLENFPLGRINWASRFYPLTNLEELTEFYGDLRTDLEGSQHSEWTGGAPIFGYLHQREVQTYGLETIRLTNQEHLQDINKRCEELLLKQYREESLTKAEQEDLEWMNHFLRGVNKDASKDLVDHSLWILNQVEKDRGFLVLHDEHHETTTNYLKDEQVSYKYIQPQSFANYLVTIPTHLIERKQKTFKRSSKKERK